MDVPNFVFDMGFFLRIYKRKGQDSNRNPNKTRVKGVISQDAIEET